MRSRICRSCCSRNGEARLRQDTRFYNNIFYVDGRVTYRWGRSQKNVFENNVFFGNQVDRPNDVHSLTNRPPLVKPGSGGNGLDSLAGYQLRDAAGWGMGKIVPNNGGRDFFGNPVPADRPPRLGADEPRQP